ncbi:PAAR domain-containing protein [Vibrio parahaemolyticus]|nr:PAAR domain-containing protein [Vibrio parahaemolyticus]
MLSNAVTVGTPTSTGGKVLTGSAGVKINNLDVSVLGDQATCACGAKNCRGIGLIRQGSPRKIKIGDKVIATKGDPVDTGCGKCFVLSSGDAVSLGSQMSDSINMGAGVNIGQSVNINMGSGVSWGGRSAASSLDTTSNSISHLSQVNELYRSEPLLYSQTQTVEKVLSDSLALECSLEEEMAKNMQHVLITDLEDAHKILHNLWLDSGKDVAALAASINTAKSWFNYTEPMFDAASIAKQFGDMNIKADLVESRGKIFVAFNGTDQNGKVLKHAFVNGTRINMNGKKYPLNSFKAMQTGFSPKSRVASFKGAGVLTFVVSASIATSDLVFKDDYHLVDWFGNVGSDMFKALVQFGAGEALLILAASANAPILVGAALVFAVYVGIEVLWGQLKISNELTKVLESATKD